MEKIEMIVAVMYKHRSIMTMMMFAALLAAI